MRMGERVETSSLHTMMNDVVLRLGREMFPKHFSETSEWKHQSKEGTSTADWKLLGKEKPIEALIETKATKSGVYRIFSPSDISPKGNVSLHRKLIDASQSRLLRFSKGQAEAKKQMRGLLEAKAPAFVAVVANEEKDRIEYGFQLNTAFESARAVQSFKEGATSFKMKQDTGLSAVTDVMRFLQPASQKVEVKPNVFRFDNRTGVFKKESGNKYIVSNKAKQGYFLSFGDEAKKRGVYGISSFGVPFLVGGKSKSDPSGLASAKYQLLHSNLFKNVTRAGLLTEIYRKQKEISTQGVNTRMGSGSGLGTNTIYANEIQEANIKDMEKATRVNVLVPREQVPELKQGMKIVSGNYDAQVHFNPNITGKNVFPKSGYQKGKRGGLFRKTKKGSREYRRK